TRRLVGVQAQGMTACPCAQELVAERSHARLTERGYSEAQIAEIFAAVPVATHNQRGLASLHVGCPEAYEGVIDAETLLKIAEQSMSSEIYELMKRADEVEVVEKAHRRPRFVEDCVREMIAGVIAEYGDTLGANAFVFSRQENLETIHQHNVVAERYGLIAEIARELQGNGDSPAHHITKREWLDQR
ncbi:MAG: GTP cyclohydrolase I FolE2, partial [Thermoleophilia bacterium]|nr:GTP cyclohydrolase I FolE2 [Thermoleophilia bacterium]